MNRAVFLVEDSPLIREELVSTLAELGAANVVGFADSQNDAVQWLNDQRGAWDDAVIDLFLQHGNGLGVLTALQNRTAVQRAIILTNYCTDAMKTRCIALGADAIFDKSTQLDEFLEYLQLGIR